MFHLIGPRAMSLSPGAGFIMPHPYYTFPETSFPIHNPLTAAGMAGGSRLAFGGLGE